MDAVMKVIVIGSYQSVSEIPGVLGKWFIIYLKTKCFKIFDDKYCC